MKFSVLMSVYKSDNPYWLYLALYSIYFQTRKADQIVIVGDGPLSDPLAKVVERFQKLLPIDYYQLPSNVGLGNALTQGLGSVRNEWVFRMDSDDICRPARFELQCQAIIDNPSLDVVGGWIAEFESIPSKPSSIRKVPCEHENIISDLAYFSPFNHVTVGFKKSSILEVGAYEGGRNFPEDYYLWLRLARSHARFQNLDAILVDVRAGSSMWQRRKGIDYFKNEMFILKLGYKWGFGSRFSLSYGIIIRLFVRLSPNWVRGLLYNFRRKFLVV